MTGATPQLHVVFGAGQIGPLLALRLAAAGHLVRMVRRSRAPGPAGITLVQGDATDPSFCADVARGATAIYHCMNPPYSTATWREQLPRIAEGLLAAAAREGARLVVLDNLYMLGPPRGRPLDEDSPSRPCSRKGEIRARVAERYLDAHRRGDAEVVIGRASDFYGPGASGSQFEGHFWSRLLAGKSVQLLMNPDTRHTYHHVDDDAAGLATLGSAADDALGRAWMLPCAPAVTTRELVAKLAAAAGHADVRIQRMPRIAVKALAIGWPLLRELDEMLYQWDEDFVVDDSRFRSAFGASATPIDEGTRAMAEWAARRYARP